MTSKCAPKLEEKEKKKKEGRKKRERKKESGYVDSRFIRISSLLTSITNLIFIYLEPHE